MLDRLFRFLFGVGFKDEVEVGVNRWGRDKPDGVRPIVALPDGTWEYINLLADCARPKDDPKRRKHWFGRGDRRGQSCLHCGVAAPAGRIK